MAKANRLNSRTLEKQYKEKLSDFRAKEKEWSQDFTDQAFVFPENFGPNMSLDEVCLAEDELWTVLSNKDRHGGKKALAALIKGTSASVIVPQILKKVPYRTLCQIEEITLDLANSMDWIARQIAPNARLTGDRFHVQKLVSEAVQSIRVRHRWAAIEEDNQAIMERKKGQSQAVPQPYPNGETKKELLARSRYLLFKPSSRWKDSQQTRAQILFQEFPDVKQAYDWSMALRNIYEQKLSRTEAAKKLNRWYHKIEGTKLKELIAAAHSVKAHEGKVLNYFCQRATNASAEAFNAKLKLFRARVRGVTDVNFFIFRLIKYFAYPKNLNLIFY